jgi:tetratricopeptide (TPR) repeat protein
MTKKISNWRILTPLGIIGAFITLTETVAGIAASRTTGAVQGGLTVFVCVFPVIVFAGFFLILWFKSHVFYPPADFGSKQDVKAYVEAMRGKAESTAELSRIEEGKAEPEPEPAENASELPDKKSAESIGEKGKPAPAKKAPTTPDELETAMFFAFMEKKLEEAEKMFSELMSAETDPTKRSQHEVWHAYLQYSYGKNANGLNQLMQLAQQPETRSDASFYLGILYEQLKEFDKAIEAYKAAVETALSNVKANRIASLAGAYVGAGKAELALSTLLDALSQTTDAKGKAALYRGIADVFAATKNEELRAIALELALEFDPYNTDLRFKLAFAYSKHGLRDLALFHYTSLLSAEPANLAALNNLGVEYQNFGMPINAVTYYRRAFEKKETLAGSNLAYSFLNAGFSDEANNVLEKAKAEDNPHPNVGSAIAALGQKKEAEEEEKKKVSDRAVAEQRFMKAFGKLRFTTSTDHFAGNWRNADGETFQIIREGVNMNAKWGDGKNKKELSGIVTNQTAKITFTIQPEHPLLTGYRHLTGYTYVEADNQIIRLLLFENRVPAFQEITRVPQTQA